MTKNLTFSQRLKKARSSESQKEILDEFIQRRTERHFETLDTLRHNISTGNLKEINRIVTIWHTDDLKSLESTKSMFNILWGQSCG